MATRTGQKLEKLQRQAIGKAEASQVVRMITQRIDYLRVHVGPGKRLGDQTTALEQIAMAVMKVKFR